MRPSAATLICLNLRAGVQNNVLGTQLLLGTLIVILTVVFHVVALVYLAALLNIVGKSTQHLSQRIALVVLLAVAVLYVISIHTVEAWTWAAVYMNVGEFCRTRTGTILFCRYVHHTGLRRCDIVGSMATAEQF